MQPSHRPILGWDANLSLWEIFNFERVFSWILTWYVGVNVDIDTLYNFYFPIKEVMHDTCIFHIERTLLFYSTKVKKRLDISYCAVPFSS